MFKRISLTGSEELFKETAAQRADFELEQHCEAHVHPLPRPAAEIVYYGYSLTEPQVRTLVDALQKLKYPHTLRTVTRPNMEEFERLEALRQLLLDGLR